MIERLHSSLPKRRPSIGSAFWRACGTVAAFIVLAAPAPNQEPTLRVVAYNIRHGEGMDNQVDLERIAAVLERLDPDVITLQEVDERTERTGGVDQPARLGELLGMQAFHGAHRPYQGGEYGNAILTRLPVRSVQTHPIPPAGESSLTVHEIEVSTGAADRTVSVVSVHLAGTPEERMRQAVTVSTHFAHSQHPVVLAGDFNAQRGDEVMQRLDEHWTLVPKEGRAETYPADEPGREIDFVMVRPAEAFEIVEHRVIDERVASDHRPILAVLRVR